MHIPVLALLVVLELLLDDANHDFVGNESTRVHNLLGLNTELGLLGDLFSEDVTGSQVADTVLLTNSWCLGSLSCSALTLAVETKVRVLTCAGGTHEDSPQSLSRCLRRSDGCLSFLLENMNFVVELGDQGLEVFEFVGGCHNDDDD